MLWFCGNSEFVKFVRLLFCYSDQVPFAMSLAIYSQLSSRWAPSGLAIRSLIRCQSSSSSNPSTSTKDDQQNSRSIEPFNFRLYETEDEKKDFIATFDQDLPAEVHRTWDGEVWDKERIARNVSRMRPAVRNNMLHVNKMNARVFKYQETKIDLRKNYARFGRESGIPAGIMWPSREEIEELHKYETETLKIPTLQESWKRVGERKKTEADKVRLRDEDVDKRMAKMGAEMAAFRARQKKADETIAAEKKKREALMEEAKEVLGYHVDPRDKRFQELLDAKEKEQQKLVKQQKKKEKEAKAVARLTSDLSEQA